MPAELLPMLARAGDTNNNPMSGAKWYFYASGTSTPQAVYADADLNTSLGSEVEADGAGKFVPIYFDAELQYRGVLKSANGATTIFDIDPLNAALISQLSGDSGFTLIKYKLPYSGTFARTAAQMLTMGMNSEQGESALHWQSPDDDDALMEETPTVAINDAVTSAAEAVESVTIPAVRANFDDRVLVQGAMPLRRLWFASGARIEQTVAEKQMFHLIGIDGMQFHCNGALFKGYGEYFGGGDAYLNDKMWNASQWTATTAVALNAFRYKPDGKVYTVTTAGTTGVTGPTGTGTGITDGSAVWTYVGERPASEPEFWSGTGHLDRAFDFYNCNELVIVKPRIINCGIAGIAMDGCEGVLIDSPLIQGTHEYSTPIENYLLGDDTGKYWANVQMGIYLRHSALYGNCDRVRIIAPDISGVAQGILNESDTATQPSRGITIVAPFIHNIPGQHAFYLQSGMINISNPRLSNITLAGVKVQSTVDQGGGIDITDIIVSGLNATTVGSNLVELAQPSGSGSVSNIDVEGRGTGVGTGYGIVGNVFGVRLDLSIDGAESYFGIVQGSGPVYDLDLNVRGNGSADHGHYFSCTDGTRIRLRGYSKNSGNSGDPNKYSVLVTPNSGSCRVDIYDPVMSSATVQYQIRTATAGAHVVIHGDDSGIEAGTGGKTLESAGTIEGTIGRAWTPTLTATSGALSHAATTVARYRIEGTRVDFSVDTTLNASETATGALYITLPSTAAFPRALSAYENMSTGDIMRAAIKPADLTKIEVTTYDGSAAVAASRRFIVSGSYTTS